MDLIIKSSEEYDYYALSDQDDYWLDEKLIKAIEKLNKVNTEEKALYFSSKKIVNSNLEFLYTLEEKEKTTLGSAMIKNIATGCTMVFNKSLMKLLKEYNPGEIEMHDAWIYRVCLSINGIIINDKVSYIKYRQHGSNVVGAREKLNDKIKRRIESLKNPKRYRSNMAKEIIKGYEKELSEENKEILKEFAFYRNSRKYKYKLLFDKRIKLKKATDNIIFKIATILNVV